MPCDLLTLLFNVFPDALAGNALRLFEPILLRLVLRRNKNGIAKMVPVFLLVLPIFFLYQACWKGGTLWVVASEARMYNLQPSRKSSGKQVFVMYLGQNSILSKCWHHISSRKSSLLSRVIKLLVYHYHLSLYSIISDVLFQLIPDKTRISQENGKRTNRVVSSKFFLELLFLIFFITNVQFFWRRNQTESNWHFSLKERKTQEPLL